jgi:hypothetical protein
VRPFSDIDACGSMLRCATVNRTRIRNQFQVKLAEMISVDQEIAELALDLHRRRRFLPSGLFPVPVPLSRRARKPRQNSREGCRGDTFEAVFGDDPQWGKKNPTAKHALGLNLTAGSVCRQSHRRG